MIAALDHVVVLANDIEAAVADYQTLLARAPAWRNTGDGAARALFTLDNATLELMAPDGESDAARHIRNLLAEQGEGMASLCFQTNDIARLHRRLDRLALQPEPIANVESRNDASETVLSWKRTRTATAATRGVRMFFLELAQPRPPSRSTAHAPITAMDHVVISTADPDRAAALYGARLGLDMALDRSHPEWGRLMFFRCGDMIVEVTSKPGPPEESRPDRLRGICWRGADIDAAHERLAAANVDVSEVRTGRKPGTRVMTVRSGTCGVPTLLVQPAQRLATVD